MSTPDDRLAAIKQTYDDANDNEPHDLAAATTAEEVTAIQANLAAARAAYYSAVAAQLTQAGPDVENAFNLALAANKSVADARAASDALPQLIGKLTSATGAATSLLNAAKGVL